MILAKNGDFFRMAKLKKFDSNSIIQSDFFFVEKWYEECQGVWKNGMLVGVALLPPNAPPTLV